MNRTPTTTTGHHSAPIKNSPSSPASRAPTGIRTAFTKATAHQAASNMLSVSALDAGDAIDRVRDNGDGAFNHGFNDQFEHSIDGKTVADAFSFTNQGNHGRSGAATKTITSTGAGNIYHDNSVFAPSTSTIPRPLRRTRRNPIRIYTCIGHNLRFISQRPSEKRPAARIRQPGAKRPLPRAPHHASSSAEEPCSTALL